MKKPIIICIVSMLMIFFSAQLANAAPTLVDDMPFDGTEGQMNLTESSTVEVNSWITVQYIGDAAGMDEYTFTDFGWTHTFDPKQKVIYDASLTIMAYDVDFDQGERNNVYADGVLLGPLAGDIGENWTETVLPIDPAMLADGQLNIWVDNDALSGGWLNMIDYSRLEVHWDYIPAPGAILLGSIGVGLVSWLRRRQTL